MVIISYAYRIFSSDVCVLTQKPRFGAERAPWASSGRAALPRVGWRPGRHHRPVESRPRAQLIPARCSLPHPLPRRIQPAPTRRSMPGMPAPRARQTTGHRHHARARNRRCRIFPDLDAKVAGHQRGVAIVEPDINTHRGTRGPPDRFGGRHRPLQRTRHCCDGMFGGKRIAQSGPFGAADFVPRRVTQPPQSAFGVQGCTPMSFEVDPCHRRTHSTPPSVVDAVKPGIACMAIPFASRPRVSTARHPYRAIDRIDPLRMVYHSIQQKSDASPEKGAGVQSGASKPIV